MTKFEKETSHWLYLFISKKQQLTRQNAIQQHVHMTFSVHPCRHDVLTVPFTLQLTSNSHYCLQYVGFKNLVLDQLILPQIVFFFILITCLLDIVLIL